MRMWNNTKKTLHRSKHAFLGKKKVTLKSEKSFKKNQNEISRKMEKNTLKERHKKMERERERAHKRVKGLRRQRTLLAAYHFVFRQTMYMFPTNNNNNEKSPRCLWPQYMYYKAPRGISMFTLQSFSCASRHGHDTFFVGQSLLPFTEIFPRALRICWPHEFYCECNMVTRLRFVRHWFIGTE